MTPKKQDTENPSLKHQTVEPYKDLLKIFVRWFCKCLSSMFGILLHQIVIGSSFHVWTKAIWSSIRFWHPGRASNHQILYLVQNHFSDKSTQYISNWASVQKRRKTRGRTKWNSTIEFKKKIDTKLPKDGASAQGNYNSTSP